MRTFDRKRCMVNYRKEHKEDIKLQQMEYKSKNREKIKNWYIKYHKKWKENNRALLREYYKIDRLKHKQNYIARRLSQNIKIPLGQICEICNTHSAEEKHHQDYSKPFEVNFVCISCHKKLHRKYL